MSKILVVDDDPHVLTVLTELLDLENLRPAAAADCAAAEAMIAAHFFPVILADFRLRSEAEGLQLLESIQRLSPRSRVASMSGHATPDMEALVRERGAQLVLEKPIDANALLAVLREMLAEVERADGGDDLEAVYTASLGALRAIARGRYRFPASDAEELIQETWCLFLEKRRAVREPRAWLSGTIANLCRQEIERRARDRARTSAEMPERATRSADDDVLAVRQALARLDPRSRALCEMLGMERRSYEEVSAAAGIPLGSVGPLFMRAKEKLRRAMSA
ncbi:MAG TPA: sigma-70 family RNA polymerase sigma factor [Thermoanaerobaculia bacterium]|nr:sigma-70 family RNA polymerase sigma factor [Thermoanaerobaculia bacterium]